MPATKLAPVRTPRTLRTLRTMTTRITTGKENLRSMARPQRYMLRFQGYTSRYGILYTSDATSEGHAHQGGRQPLPYPRPPPSDARQQAGAHSGADAEHPDADARRREVPGGRRYRARYARRASDAVSLQRRRPL